MGGVTEALGELKRLLSGEIVEAAESLGRFEGDASHLRERPAAIVRPADPSDVVSLVRWARRVHCPLVARGGGSSLEGESVPSPGAIVVDFSGWNALTELDEQSRIARVGPGIVNLDLQRSVAPAGLFFPPNPGSWGVSTLGGNVATNASGPRSFRYGSVRQWVLAAEVVLGTGAKLTVGNLSSKRSTGPDLLQLLIGSEGTLGLFTELTLRLALIPPRRIGLILSLSGEPSVGSIAQRLASVPDLCLSAIEYLDLGSASALAAEEGARLPRDRPLVLLEIESRNEDDETRQLERLSSVIRSLGLREDPLVYPDADRLWSLRGRSGVALDRRWGARVREDVGVPLALVDRLLASIRDLAHRHQVAVHIYGHLGEGNLHPNFIVDPTSEVAGRIRAELLAESRRLGGTISAEHGIGTLKSSYLSLEVGDEGLALLRSVKGACDPDGILNPGKLYSWSGA